jgi:monoamine oxidase
MLYQQHLDTECRKTVGGVSVLPNVPPSVGIVGGGMAGLYSALLLQKHIPGVEVKIFEADNRVGGRVYTHKFSSEPYQYYDTGAMRVPDTESHKPVFTLIDHLNKEFPNDPITILESSSILAPRGTVYILTIPSRKMAA